MYFDNIRFHKQPIQYQNLKHKAKDAECHELQEVFLMLHINSIEKLRKSYRSKFLL